MSGSDSLTGSAHRGWPMARLGPRRILLEEGRIGPISIFDTRADVERILGVERKSLLWVSRDPAPPVVLRIGFESDEDDLYDAEEMILHAKELDALWADVEATPVEETVTHIVEQGLAEEQRRSDLSGDLEPTTNEVALRPEEDGIVDLSMDWSDVPAGCEHDDAVPEVILPGGRIVHGCALRLEDLTEVLGPASTSEEMDDGLLCEWPGDDYLITATISNSGRVLELGFSHRGLLG
jgi:hypothetical protein